jgi:hypothetical protein
MEGNDVELTIGGYEWIVHLRRGRPRVRKPRLSLVQVFQEDQERRARERREFQARRRNLSDPLFYGGGWI